MKIIFWNNLFTLLALVGYADMNDKCHLVPEAFVQSQPIKAVVNKGTLLPCLPKFTFNVIDVYVEWSKEGEDIYKVENGRPKEDSKYKIELNSRNASLILFNVTLSDKGKYCCCIIQFINSESNMTCTNLTLDVVSEDVKPKPTPKEEGRRDQPGPKEVKPPPEDIYSFWKTTEGYITIGGVVGAVLLFGAGVGIYWCCKQPQTQPKRKDSSTDETEMDELNKSGASDLDAKPTTSKNPARQTKPRNSPKKSSRQKNRRS